MRLDAALAVSEESGAGCVLFVLRLELRVRGGGVEALERLVGVRVRVRHRVRDRIRVRVRVRVWVWVWVRVREALEHRAQRRLVGVGEVAAHIGLEVSSQ